MPLIFPLIRYRLFLLDRLAHCGGFGSWFVSLMLDIINETR